MSSDPHTLAIIVVMTVAAALCRLAGYWFMRFVPVTRRVEAALQAVPLAVMIAIIGPPVLHGGLPEVAGVAATIAAARWSGSDLLPILAGMATVAGTRLLV